MPDAVRRAVERTVQSTVGSAGLTRDRAQEIVDEVVRRAEQSAARAGRVRESVGRAGHRQAEAAAGVGDRLRDAIPDIRVVTRDDLNKLRRELERLGKRIDRLEGQLAKERPARKPARPRTKSVSASRTSRAKR